MRLEIKSLYLFGDRFCCNRFAAIWIKMLLGGIAYGLLEVMWRGYTHPSMVIAGGFCFAMMLTVHRYLASVPLILKSAICALGITAVEFGVGMLVNRLWQMEVWDYSEEWMHLFGQICPLYSCLWFFISLCVLFLLSAVKYIEGFPPEKSAKKESVASPAK